MEHVAKALLVALLFPAVQAIGQDRLDKRSDSLAAALERVDADRMALLSHLENTKLAILRRDLYAMGLPAMGQGEKRIDHPGHSLVYDPSHHVPRWTAHIVTPDIVTGNLARIDTFKADPKATGSIDLFKEYWYSGYDRGHMVPSADMRWSQQALEATYYYSNIAPQAADLNRGVWAELEDWVRRSVRYGNERVFVVTGPVLSEGMDRLSTPDAQATVRIPRRYFKAIADLDGPEKKGIAFLLENGPNTEAPMSYAVTIDSIEALTGLDLFHSVPDDIEGAIEAQNDPKPWYHEGDPFFGEVPPIKPPLPKGMFNTAQAKFHIGNEVTICGTVVSTRRTVKANAIYLNMDRLHPHQDFYATVWDYNGPNFSYDPETYLLNRKVCVSGKVTTWQDVARISVNNEKEIQFWEEIQR
ncbi:MAG: DNA/RNA non-specific endonuclease [Flavobacteriales bacterium]|nr:DNA/RNA non-specific endonuclease [Flavobacteriales bacterium]